jgi:tRNA dimethylallyltransferase
MHKKAICLMGPTASGKTALSIALACDLPIEIISVDSAQIYQGMDIGSAKPSIEERQKVKHHLIDILVPHERYNAGQFCQDAYRLINEIQSRNHIPLLVGGTMMYFKALQQGLSDLPHANMQIRQQLDEEVHRYGLDALYEKLNQVDAISAQKIKPTDKQRIQRALEVFMLTRKPLSDWHDTVLMNSNCEYINLALMPIDTPRGILHDRIENRFRAMLSQGLVEEVKAVWGCAVEENLPAKRCVGYRQVGDFLVGKCNYEEMQAKAIAATRQLAKRQMTWLRHWSDCHYFDFLNINPTKMLEFIQLRIDNSI